MRHMAVAAEYGAIQQALETLFRRNASRRVHARQAEAAGVDLSPPAALLLRRICGDGPLTMGELARLAGMDPGATARGVGVLEKAALVRRTPSRDDGRVTHVAATPQGQAVRRTLTAVTHTHLADVLADWTPADRADFARLLERFVEDLRVTPYRPAGGSR